ncbi:hypothetical protein ACLI4U_19005 (plasmid) [Natrialbaceae archaeon A-CW2]
MAKILPDPQIGGIGGILLWLFGLSIVIVFLFTSGLGPVLLWMLMAGAVLLVIYFILARIIFRLKRGR